MIANIKAITQAAEKLGLPYKFIDKNHNVVCIKDTFYFSNAATPLNREDVADICKDKEFTYNILKDSIKTPKTKGYFDPHRDDHKAYRTHNSLTEIAEDISSNFTFPIMVKRNRGERGLNVIKCSTKSEALEALEKIYDQSSKHYDYVALAQEYIEPKDEFRVTVLNRKVVLMYTWVDKKPTIVSENDSLFKTIEDYLAPVFEKIDLVWAGIDIVRDKNNEFHLLELNSKPGFNHFCEHNGLEPLTQVFEKVLSHLFKK
jgi:glutathione synthase/RimK-type ligase-like ATP-grasp enzyme